MPSDARTPQSRPGAPPPASAQERGDFNGDGDFGTDQDIEAALADLAGWTPLDLALPARLDLPGQRVLDVLANLVIGLEIDTRHLLIAGGDDAQLQRAAPQRDRAAPAPTYLGPGTPDHLPRRASAPAAGGCKVRAARGPEPVR